VHVRLVGEVALVVLSPGGGELQGRELGDLAVVAISVAGVAGLREEALGVPGEVVRGVGEKRMFVKLTLGSAAPAPPRARCSTPHGAAAGTCGVVKGGRWWWGGG
jgi:hypothetical protein